MNEYASLLLRCLIFYCLIIAYLRIMGKREVGELSVIDLVLYFLMTELLAISINSIDESIWKTILPVTLLAVMQISLAWLLLKHKRIRDIVEGKPAILIRNGTIQQAEMRRQRYTIDDLMFQLRANDIGSVSEVEFAILENSGILTVLTTKDCIIAYPFPLISDGEFIDAEIKDANLTIDWLKEELAKQGYTDETQIFLCLLEQEGLRIVEKQSRDHPQAMHQRRTQHPQRK